MKIAVCIKRVPDTTAKITLAAGGQAIDESGLKFVTNPYDEFALEAALALKEQAGAGETVAIALGADAVQETLRSALAMGIDRAVHLQGTPGSDGLATATVIANALRDGGYDLILFGKVAVDDYNHQVGAMVAELLGRPCVTAVVKLDIAGTSVTAEREIEGGVETSTCALPAVITCDKGLNTPRLPSLKGIMAAKKKPLEVVPVTPPAPKATVASLTLPAERAAGRIVGEGVDAVPVLVSLLRTEAKVL